MRGIVYHGAGDMRVESVPDPKPQDARSAIVRVEATAICGSDLHLYHGLMMTDGPFTVGHEFIGEVVEVGSEVRNFKSGDRVIVAGVIGCGDCDSCRRGEVVRCLNHMNRVFGVMPDLPGGQAEAVAVPGADYSMTLMPDGISEEQAVLLTDILPTGFFGAKSARINPGDTVAILGAGPVGIQALICAQLYGPSRIIVVDPVPERRALAVSLGAEAVTPDNALMHVIEATGGQGADAVIEAVGAQETIHSGMMLARPGAVLAVIGVNLEMDFTQRETTREQYLDFEPERAEVRSEVITSDSQTGIAASGIPGGTTNIPPDQPEVIPEGEVAANPTNTETATTEREQTTRNYELDKEITFVKEQAGRVVSMTAGVIVNEEALRDLAKRRYYASLDEQPVNTGDLLDGEPTEGDAGALEGAAATLAPIPSAELQRYMADELEQLRALVLTALPYNAERGDALTIRSAPFFTDPVQDYLLPWHKDPAIIEWGRHGMTSIGLIAFFLLVIAPVLRVYMPKIEESDALLAEQLIDGELSIADRKALEEGESLDEIKAKLKPKKSAISADMLDTANSYDDKVAVVRLLVAEDAGRVANVLKKMIKPV